MKVTLQYGDFEGYASQIATGTFAATTSNFLYPGVPSIVRNPYYS
jgi:hypothetical protein